MKEKILLFVSAISFAGVLVFALIFNAAYTAKADTGGGGGPAYGYAQPVTLKPGWNIVSTPRIVQSHQFSVEETSANFDIIILDGKALPFSSETTMANLGYKTSNAITGSLANYEKGTAIQ